MSGKLIEQVSLRDALGVFGTREEAGRALVPFLGLGEGESGFIILGIPSGGVPVAAELSKALRIPMELVISRKLQIPWNPEAGFGGVSPDGTVALNEPLVARLVLSKDVIREQTMGALKLIREKDRLLRGSKPFPSLKGKIAVIVDDGLASGFTMLAAVRYVKKAGPHKTIVAVPTAFEGTARLVLKEVDELYCLNVRAGARFAVAEAYRHWRDLTNSDVLEVLGKLRKMGLYP